MEQPPRSELELETDPRQQKREWRLQRIAWALLYALLAAVIFGLLGNGPLSTSRLASDDGALVFQYEKFLRHDSQDSLQISLKSQADTVEMRLDSAYMARIKIEQIMPEPARIVSADDAVTFIFHSRPGATMQAVFLYSPARVGPLHGWISAGGQARQPFSQFVYP